LRLADAAEPARGVTAFLREGWYADRLYGTLFVGPFRRLAPVLWQKIDEGIIDDAIDHLADATVRAGKRAGSWTCGRVAVYLTSFAAGAALVLIISLWRLHSGGGPR
jgi:NADH-quinone oxidoreductase subunit L